MRPMFGVSFQFQTDGFVVLEDFTTDEDVEAMKAECYDLVEKMDPSQHHTVFSTTKKVDLLLTSYTCLRIEM